MVNTFIIANSPKKCMELLDYRRLGKQRVEAYQIINVIENDEQKGYRNHPIVKMWKDYLLGLKYYFNCCIDEWIFRGYKNTMKKYEIECKDEKEILPWWFCNEQLQESHRMSLLRKDPEFYSSLFNKKQNYYQVGYVWICNLSDDIITKMKNNEECLLQDICEKIGSGTPSHFRYTKKEVATWFKNKNVHPKTQKNIKTSGTIYKDLEKAYKHYFKNE